MSEYRLKQGRRDGRSAIKFKCPGCGIWGNIDSDQYHGRISIRCTECDFHKTINLARLVAVGDISIDKK